MNDIELIPMNPGYRRQLKNRYCTPLLLRLIFCFIFLTFIHLLVLSSALDNGEQYITIITSRMRKVTLSREALTTTILFSFLSLGYLTVKTLTRIGRHYYKDYRLGHIVKEYAHISNVVDTPAGIYIYWTDSDVIFTFVPDPPRILAIGTPVTLYYLRYTKECLRYEIPSLTDRIC